MSRRLVPTTLFAFASVFAFALSARADFGDGGQQDPPPTQPHTSTTVTSGDGVIVGEVDLGPVDYSGGRTHGTPTPRCTFQLETRTLNIPGVGSAIPPYTRPARDGVATQTLYRRFCTGQPETSVWISDRITTGDLLPGAVKRVEALIPKPALNMNPTPDHGGIVNIGLWLAINDPGPITIRAAIGTVWVQVTATYTSSHWDMGNGDTVDCDGLGTPIIDTSTAEQGPCGYTYRYPSIPKLTSNDYAYAASATGNWTITFTTSSGTAGSLEPITASNRFDYPVKEIQTLGG